MAEEAKPEFKPDVPGGSEHINLKVTDQNGTIVHFKIKKNTPLRKLMNAYCERQGFQKSAIRFKFDGTPVGESETPIDLDMEDEDTIEVFQEQTGGR